MRSYQGNSQPAQVSWIPQIVLDYSKTIFQISVVTTVLLYGYLLYGLFTGALVNVPHMPHAEQARVLENIQRFSLWLNISLGVLITTAVLLYYEESALGFIFLGIAAFMAYGLQFVTDYFFASEAAKYTTGQASEMTLHEIWQTGIIFGIPGILLILRHIVVSFLSARHGQDLLNPTYGKDAQKEDDIHRPLIGVFAKCWQIPYCREGIRVKCPIFHAKTKCWKERVGCMCEENIIRLAMGGEDFEGKVKNAMGKASGFVPLGDLLTESNAEDIKKIPMRKGPRGVKIPVNPHITRAQQVQRCRNCVIYNEHQRYKYQSVAPLITLAVPLLVYLQFDPLRDVLANVMNGLDKVFGHLSFSAASNTTSDLTRNVTGSLPVETVIIICLTMIMMTWALRFVEYCVFKIKI